MTILRIENWYCTKGFTIFDFILPKPCAKLGGDSYGLSYIPDGTHIKTFFIKSFNGRQVTTGDNNVWELGEINELYLEFLRNEKWEYEEDNPLQRVA